MTTVVFSCPFVPAEWIAAHGLRPSRQLPEPAGIGAPGPTAGCCPYAWAFVNTVRRLPAGTAVVLTTVCDQMRRAHDSLVDDAKRPVFLMHVPTTCETSESLGCFRGELQRLGRFLVGLGGIAPSRDVLSATMADYDDRRRRLRDCLGRLASRERSVALAEFNRDGTVPNAAPQASRCAGARVALVGPPLLPVHRGLFDALERAGATVALDATGAGERTLLPSFDRRRLRVDPFNLLAETVFWGIPDAFRRPNGLLYRWLSHECSGRDVQGIVFHTYAWCDTWHAETQRMKEWAGVPVLTLIGADTGPVRASAASRIEAFVEMLR